VSEAACFGILQEIVPGERLESTVLAYAGRLAALPRDAYAHAKAALIHAALARVEAETPEQAALTRAVWTSAESRLARARQREKLGIRR
jgi:hypothetical protein